MTTIRAIDPGSEKSAWVELNGERVLAHGIYPNQEMLIWLRHSPPTETVIEWMTPRGMPTSAQEFETVWWIGRFTEAIGEDHLVRLPRVKVKTHICGNPRANDSNIIAALIDRYGGVGGRLFAVGVKARPGPLYGVSRDVWQALALGLTYQEAVR